MKKKKVIGWIASLVLACSYSMGITVNASSCTHIPCNRVNTYIYRHDQMEGSTICSVWELPVVKCLCCNKIIESGEWHFLYVHTHNN